MFLSEYPSLSLFRKHGLGTFLSLLLLSACSPDNDALPGDGGGNTSSAELRIEVSASDFATTRGDVGNSNGSNNTATRATDNGNITSFENGDCIGIIVLDNSNNVLSDNIPYKYNGNAWSFDATNSEGKTAIYYDNKAVNLTYLAYFPYSKEANGVTDIAGLKEKFPPQYDQRTKAAYRASDLLVWSKTFSGTPSKTLAIAFTHAYSSLSLSPSIKCKINGAETSYVPSSVSDASFTIGTEPLLPYCADDGRHRIIVSPQTTDARWLCAYGGAMHSGTMGSTELSANTRYTLAPILDIGTYSLDNACVGDFYCRADDGTGYLVPGEAVSIINLSSCVGLVFYVGRHPDDKTDYSTTKIGQKQCHGYVMALTDVNTGSNDRLRWEYRSSDNKYNQQVGTSTSDSDWNGYSNTQAIKQYVAENSGGWAITDFPAANGCLLYGTDQSLYGWQTVYAAPTNSSGWFLPSAGQLSYLYENRSDLAARIQALGSKLESSYIKWFSTIWYYWSSSEYSDYSSSAYRVDFYGGYVDWYGKDRTYDVRAVSAF
ncbi:fimbrillin family protein [Bacteroides faecium]|uniref:DUF1566 domain-containing protein n=1 Tax=Bacteroides faecium TaxID=2715212 RepID=A0A6H0KSQ0_9BACE|nr:fimbrillin family protein [Bacteroides faecium]QIU95457.1 hypothetical protein BacF7301_15440 [Bacteroides faecium]